MSERAFLFNYQWGASLNYQLSMVWAGCIRGYFGILVCFPFRPPNGCTLVLAAWLAAATFPEQKGFLTRESAAGKEFVFFNCQLVASLNYQLSMVWGGYCSYVPGARDCVLQRGCTGTFLFFSFATRVAPCRGACLCCTAFGW